MTMNNNCLSGHTVIQLLLHASSGHPISVKPGIKQSDYNVRVSVTQRPLKDSIKPELSKAKLLVLKGNDHTDVNADDHNEIYQEKDFCIYSASTTDPSSIVFKIVVCSSINTIIGHGFVSASQMIGSAGSLVVTLINGSLEYIGTITVSYLVIRPWSHPQNHPQCEQARRTRAISGMKANGQYYYSGHRGAGESFKESIRRSIYPENTIGAFKAASRLGIDFVEMDVQVSKDKVPVVFHDGTVKLHLQDNTLMRSPGKKRTRDQMTPEPTENMSLSSSSVFEIPLKDLTLEQMQNAKVAGIKDHEAYLKAKEDGVDSIELDFKLFPTLKEVFDYVPEETGLLLEVKYPLAELGGESVDYQCMDPNEFVDAILQVVYENAKDRKIILASFDPNICCMLQLKQNKFPVYIITQDNTALWVPYLDLRTRHIDSAIAFAKAHHLDGVHTFSGELMTSPEKIDKVLEAGLILSVWGSRNEDPETRRWLHEHGVQCIQIDNIFEATKKT